MHQIRFWLGFAPDPAEEAHSVPRLSGWILGVILLRGGSIEGEEEGERKGEGKQREGTAR